MHMQVRDYLWKLSLGASDIAVGMMTQQGREKLVDNILYNYDFNGDGVLSLEEFQTPVNSPRDELWRH